MFKKLFFLLIFAFWDNLHESPLLFSEFSSKGRIKYETKRTLCIYSFRKSDKSQQELNYLENGIPEVIYSSLRDFHFIYEEAPLEEVIVYPFQSTVIEKDFHNSILLEKKLILDKSISFEQSMLEGAKDLCSYMLTGEYEVIGTNKLKTKIQITNRVNGKTSTLEKETSLKRAFQELQESAFELKQKLSPKGLSELKIESEEENTKVTIDGMYYGTTPFQKKDLTPNKHKVLLEKEGFEKLEFTINLEKEKSKTLKVKLKKSQEDFGYLTVDSNPKGAFVYLGNQFLGTTPLEKAKVKVGKNRLKITLENHIEEFRGIEIEKEKTISLNVQLKEGDTKEYYKKRLNLFQDYTYFDFSLYSLYGSLVFYATYMYATYRISKDEDKLYAITTWNELNTLNQFQNISSNFNLETQNSFLLGLFFQESQINRTRKNIQTYQTIQNASAVGVVGMLVSSILFYNFGISSDAVEFGYFPKNNWQEGETFFSIRLKWN